MTRSIVRVADLVGVGPVLRQRIIAELGADPERNGSSEAFAVAAINHDPYALLDVPGIGMHRIVKIMNENYGVVIPDVVRRVEERHKSVSLVSTGDAAKASASPEVRARLSELPGLGPALAERVVDFYRRKHADVGVTLDPSRVLEYVERDPYALMSVPGVGFKKADTIALQHYGMSRDAPRRHQHANLYLLSSRAGVMREREYHERRERMGLRDRALATLGVQFDRGYVWDREELIAERELAAWALEMCTGSELELPDPPEAMLAEMHAFGLNQEQRIAVWAGMRSPAVALTGGAGTGKTTAIAALASIASRRGLNVHLMAFAGKGSDRIAEALAEFRIDTNTTGPFGNTSDDPFASIEAYGRVYVSTIHRGLAANANGHFFIDELTSDLIILDEASMLPNRLLTAVLERMKDGARLVLVGDPNQLPPIQYGAPFEALLGLGLPHVHLVRNYRQANQQAIFELAEAVRVKRPRAFVDAAGVELRFEADLEASLQQVVREVSAASATSDPLAWQAVCALNVTRERVNALVQEWLNPGGVPLARYREYGSGAWVEIRQGDKVVVVKNDYEKGVFNGQTGRVLGAQVERQALMVQIGASVVLIEFELVSQLLRLGYAITTHKSQGSGWHTVVVVEPQWHRLTPNRWAYTSITRAAQRLVLITELQERDWWRMVMNDPPIDSGVLHERVQELRSSGCGDAAVAAAPLALRAG